MQVRTPLTLLAATALSACSLTSMMTPYSQASLPVVIQVPEGNKVALQTSATGDLTYECRVKKDVANQFEWAFAAPQAVLKDRTGKTIGKYYGPPATWEINDGSKITGTQIAIAPNGVDNIPMQLTKVNSAMGTGVMQGISFVQRINTQAGIAPKAACFKDNVGQNLIVSYTADYIFWRGI